MNNRDILHRFDPMAAQVRAMIQGSDYDAAVLSRLVDLLTEYGAYEEGVKANPVVAVQTPPPAVAEAGEYIVPDLHGDIESDED